MPLEHSATPAALHRNMHTLMGEIGKSPHVQSREQAIAIALNTQRRAQGRDDGGGVAASGNPFGAMLGLDAMGANGIAPSYAAGGATTDPVQQVISALQQGSNGATPMSSGYPGNGMGTSNPAQPSSPAAMALSNPTSVASGIAPTATNPAAVGVAPALMPVPKKGGGPAQLAIGGFDIAKGMMGRPPWFERAEARQLHIGPVLSQVPGRTDNHQIKVPSGSYVLPAQHIASMGHGNSLAGMSMAHSMFGGYVPGGGGMGGGYVPGGGGMRAARPHFPKPPSSMTSFAQGGMADGGGEPPSPSVNMPGSYDSGDAARKVEPVQQENLAPVYQSGSPPGWYSNPDLGGMSMYYDASGHPWLRRPGTRAEGGVANFPHGGMVHRHHHNGFEPVPVDVSGGEYIIPPWAIIRRYGSLKNGHNVLDKWVMDTRKEEINIQKKLPPPATRWMGGSVWGSIPTWV
jgi:hypothetical protein